MAFRAAFLACFVAVAYAAPQHIAHSHAEITINKATTHRDTIHETSPYHQEHSYHQSAPVVHQYQHQAPSHHQQEHSSSQSQHNEAPVVHHVAPVVHHIAPLVKHIEPVVHHVAPVVHHIEPVVHHEAPVVHHVEPVVHHVAPVVHHVAPIVKHVAPVVHHVAPIAHASQSQSSISHHHSEPTHYAPIAKVAVAPVTKYVTSPQHHHHEEEEYGPAEYSFEYSVHDEHTGDIKSHKEERHGDEVKGSYMLVEPDGSRRIVEYTVDKHSGFNAVVHREEAKHPVVVKPVLKKIVAPVAVVAPVHSYHH